MLGNGEFSSKEFEKAAKITRWETTRLLFLISGGGIDEKHLGDLIFGGEKFFPVVANIDIQVGIGLDEDQPTTGRGESQLAVDSRGMVLLLGGGVNQDVAVGEEPMEAFKITAGGFGFVRVGVGTVDQDHRFEEGQ